MKMYRLLVTLTLVIGILCTFSYCGTDTLDNCHSDADCFTGFGCDLNDGYCYRQCSQTVCPSGYDCDGTYCRLDDSSTDSSTDS